MAFRIRLRRRTAAAWTSANEVLLDSEIGIESDTRKFKFGDGATAWNSLTYVVSSGFDDRVNILLRPPFIKTVTGTANIFSLDNSQIGQGFLNKGSGAANGDKFSATFSVGNAGLYDLIAWYFKAGDAGITDIAIDGVVVLSVDPYFGSNVYNVSATASSIAIVPGKHKITFTINGHNASSGGYESRLTSVMIVPHAAD